MSWLTAAAWVLGLATTTLILVTPYLVFGRRTPSLHLTLDSVDACIALLLAYLLYGRFVRSGRWRDLQLAQGLMLLGLAGPTTTLLVTLTDQQAATLDVWLPLTLRTGAALLVLAAALGGERPVALPRSTARLPLVLVLLAATAVWLLRDQLPVALDQDPPTSAQHPLIVGHPLLLVVQAVAAVSFLAASIAFARSANRRRDELLRWLGPACALSGFARVNYVLFPSLYTDWVYTGDALRTASYALLLVGATREIRGYWSAQAETAVLEDRRRVARELHDGVVQELAYIRLEAQAMQAGQPRRHEILGATERALDEARAAIDVLGRGGDEPIAVVVERAARQVADRYGGHLDLDVDRAVDVSPEQRHAIVRITREAVSNALRHSGSRRVALRLSRDRMGCRLVVRDEGSGFHPGEEHPGYGLTSMRERAQGLPGTLEVWSHRGRGTTVGVSWSVPGAGSGSETWPAGRGRP